MAARCVSRLVKVIGFGAMAVLTVAAGSAPAQAAPPPHAPAHGYRAKQAELGYDRSNYGYGAYDDGYVYVDRTWRSDGWDRYGRRSQERSRYSSRMGRWGDFDGDRIPNCHDRDIDNDGIRNERDRDNFSRGRFGGYGSYGARDGRNWDRGSRYEDRYDDRDDRYDRRGDRYDERDDRGDYDRDYDVRSGRGRAAR